MMKTWMLYPLAVICLVIFSASWFLGNTELMDSIAGRQEKIHQSQIQVAELKARLAVLEAVDTEVTREQLKKMIGVMPASRQLWLMASEANTAASESGLILETFKGLGGKTGEASEAATVVVTGDSPLLLDFRVNATTVEVLEDFLTKLERKLPLVKVAIVKYDMAKAQVTIEGAWSSWSKVAADVKSPMPGYQAELNALNAKLTKYETLAQEEVQVVVTEGANPF